MECIELAMQADLLSQVETLNAQIKEMETLMNNLRDKSPSLSLLSLSDDTDSSTLGDFPIPYIASLNNFALPEALRHGHLKPYPLIESKEHDVYAHIAHIIREKRKEDEQRQPTPWTVTLRKGQLSIETKVSTHTDLMNNLYNMLSTAELYNQIPSLLNRFSQKNAWLSHLNVFVRKKYGSVHCRNVARSVRIFVTPSHINDLTLTKPPDSIQTTTIKLIRAYFRCLHLQHLAIHAKTFIKLFVEDEHVAASSPATMALCAAICTMRCKHVADCLPSITLVEYGNFYFEQAKELVSDMFDKCNLETLTTYTFMTSYKLAISQYNEAQIYADLAERMATVLATRYESIPTNDKAQQGEAVHFSRLRNYLHSIQTYKQVTVAYDPAIDNSIKRLDLLFCTLLNRTEGKWDVSEDDSIQEKWFAKMHTKIIQLHRLQYDASQTLETFDLTSMILLLCHQVEMAIRHWYYVMIPDEFRLSLPLFDSNISSSEFFTTLERECAHSAIPALTTLAAYEEWLTMGQSYMPKKPPVPGEGWNDLPKFWNGGRTAFCPVSPKWEARIRKLNDFRDAMEYDGTDDEFFQAVCSIVTPGNSRLDEKVILLNLHAAFNTVQLIQFLRSRSTDCYFDMRYLINAWQFLIRVSRLKKKLTLEIQEMIPRVHEHLNLCMLIIQEELQLQPYQGTMSEYAAQMEKDLRDEVDNDEESCTCTACPNDPDIPL